jgi:hypothetical protein
MDFVFKIKNKLVTVVFYTFSYTFISSIGAAKLLKLQKISDTRWWSKEKALIWVFGPNENLFSSVLSVLSHIASSPIFDGTASTEASGLITSLTSFNIIATAHLFLKIFEFVGPLSRYLQKKNLDIMSAWTMMEAAREAIKELNCGVILRNAKNFSEHQNASITVLELPDDVFVQTEFPPKRISRKKKMASEQCSDERLETPADIFRVETFRCILDQIISSISERFSANKVLISEIGAIHPKNFQHIVENGISAEDLSKMAHYAKVDKEKLRSELISFAKIFEDLVGPFDQRKKKFQNTEDESDDDQDDFTNDENQDLCNKCKKCFIGMYEVLYNNNFHTTTYPNLYAAVNFILTLSFSQVSGILYGSLYHILILVIFSLG